MPFLAYVAIILVSLGGILFELNWLTSPKLETTPAVQASASAPKVADKTADPTLPKVADATITPRNVAPTVTMVPAASTPQAGQQASQAKAEEPALKGTASSEPAPSNSTPNATPSVTPSAPPPQPATASAAGTAPAINPAPFGATETTGVASTDFKREFTTDAKSDSALSAATFTPAATATPVAAPSNNKCDIAACSAAYQSLRSSDCSYQPMDGTARKVCDRTQGSAQQASAQPGNTQAVSIPSRDRKIEAAVRKPNKDAELRSFEREVRRITASEAALDTGADRGYERAGRSQVIVIDRRDW